MHEKSCAEEVQVLLLDGNIWHIDVVLIK